MTTMQNPTKAAPAKQKRLTDYWLAYYGHPTLQLCSLCGNSGIIDTTKTAISAAGVNAGRRNFCICPNGQAMRKSASDGQLTMSDQPTTPQRESRHTSCRCGGRRPSSCPVTAEIVRAALDEHVQYMVPTSDINTPYRVDLQNALQGIADHINKALNDKIHP